MTIQEFIDRERITLKAEYADINPNMDDDGKDRMDHWKVTLRRGSRRMTLPFSMGSGHNGKEPTVYDVLTCLQSDAGSSDQDFESWAGDLGYDTDSRKAERTYKACQRSAVKLQQFLGETFAEFMAEVVDA